MIAPLPAATALPYPTAPQPLDRHLTTISLLFMLMIAVTVMLLGEKTHPDRSEVTADRWLDIQDQAMEAEFRVSSELAIAQPSNWLPEISAFLQGTGRQPELLDSKDRERYRQAFILQDQGEWNAADQMMRHIRVPLLHGYLLAERYLKSNYPARFEELVDWLKRYADHPQAERIEQLAWKKNPHAGRMPVRIRSGRYLSGYGDQNGLSGNALQRYGRTLDWSGRPKAQDLWFRFQSMLAAERTQSALALADGTAAARHWKQEERDLARLMIGNVLYASGKPTEALKITAPAARRSGARLPLAYWTAGLASWRQGGMKDALWFFSHLAKSRKADAWERAGGAFWAARAAEKLERGDEARRWLHQAVEAHPRSFYGILANARLGRPLALEDSPPPLAEDIAQQAAKLPAVQRVIALAALERKQEAERELRHVFLRVSPTAAESLVALAHRLQITAAELRMARAMTDRHPEIKQQGRFLDYAFYPIPSWRPANGFTTDAALLFAIVRHESGFNPKAQSHKGAQGLMQLMPATANYVEKKLLPSDALELPMTPIEANVQLGQAYIEYLQQKHYIEDSLMHLLAAYNAGPGTLHRWLKGMQSIQDPLLFMESLPSPETRNYLEQVMTAYWIYRRRMSLEVPTLDALAHDRWPMLPPPPVTETASI